MAKYNPPEQSKAGQLFDALFLLALVFAALFAPLYLKLAGGGKTSLEFADKTWAGMNQNETMVAQWDKLGLAKDEAGAIPQGTIDMIASRFDYAFDPINLVLTALLVIAYFYIVLHWSKKEYRDVIDEKFNNK
jgi:hypothetical protein